jgi:hypothetical protein
LEKKLEVTLNFLRRIITSIAKLVLHVIVILNSEEEMEIRLQPIIEEISQLVIVSRLVEKGELQQLAEEQSQLILVPRPMEEK